MSVSTPTLEPQVVNTRLNGMSPEQIVAWAAEQFGSELVMTSSFGADSAVLLHMATQVMPSIRVIFIDTGYLFPETHAFMEQLRQRLNLNVWNFRTHNDPIAYLHRADEENPEFRKDTIACCAANKHEPMHRAMGELAPAAWLRGVRANQTPERMKMQPLEWSERYQCYAVSPLLRWTTREIYQYLKRHDLPHHPLYEKGYLSIGCNPRTCTSPVQPGDDPRAGRWNGSKTECGINLNTSLDSASL